MRARRRRSGGSAVEQALIAPVLLVLLVAGFEYGWTMFRVHQIEAFARQAGRIAAATPVDDDPEAVFTTEFEERMVSSGLGSDGLSITTVIDGEAPEATLEVAIQLEWGGLTGLIPTPESLSVNYSTWLEDQARRI